MAAPDLVENGYRPQARRALQQGHHLAAQTAASGSGLRRPRGAFFCDGSRRSCSMR
jgi:hypothetical protein